jgi:hypothetical protein
MGQRALLAAILVLASATSCQAISLVVMASNSSPGVAGAKAFTIGIQIAQGDLLAPGVGAHPTLALKNLTFLGSTPGPIQGPGPGNVPDIQSAWNNVDLSSPNSILNDGFGAGGPSFPVTGSATTQLYKDSWWYSSPTGTLQGINGFTFEADTFGTVTTVPNGGFVYAQGPGAAVGITGFLWAPQGNGITGGGAASGGVSADMSYTGVYGPGGGLDLTSPAFASQFINGILTLPLAELIIKGDVGIQTSFALGEYLSFGQATYDIPNVTDLVFANNQLQFATFVRVPEPSSLVLAALGVCGVLMAHRQRAMRRATDVSQV